MDTEGKLSESLRGEQHPFLMQVSWEEYAAELNKLCEAIRGSGARFDRIVAISRGGIVAGLVLSHRLEIPLVVLNKGEDIDHINAGSILVTDDVVDTGRTVALLLLALNGCEMVAVASVYKKPCSVIDPTFYNKVLDSNCWLQFPWETGTN